MVGSLFAEQGRLEDPQLWDRAVELGLDLDRFVEDSRSDAIAELVAESFRSAIRAGVVTSPTLLVGTELHPGVPEESQLHDWAS